MYYSILPRYFLLMVMLLAISCKRSLEIGLPVQLISSDKVFIDDKSAISAVTGIYADMMRPRLHFTGGGLSISGALLADEVTTVQPDASMDEYGSNSLLPTNSTMRLNFWRYPYMFVYRTNACLEGIANSRGVSDATRKQLNGELKTLRAFIYFYLVNTFGDVPFIRSTDYEENAATGRTGTNNIYSQLIIDLSEARVDLSVAYPSSGRVRINKHAATALLARLYLYTQQWALAEQMAGEVIGSGVYQLETDLSRVFLANSKETIWELLPVVTSYGNNTHDALYYLPACGTCNPTLRIRPGTYAIFDTVDKRKANWVGMVKWNNDTIYYNNKYKMVTNNPAAPVEYNVTIRLAEMILLRSEARARQQKISESLQDLNTVRARAGLSSLTITDQGALVATILLERRKELLGEWAHRWFDLKRTGASQQVLAPLKGASWQATDTLFPVPFAELQLNPALTQNPGY